MDFKYTELMEKIERNLDRKIKGEGKIKTSPECLPGLEYALNALRATDAYFSLTHADPELKAKIVHSRFKRVLKDYLNGNGIAPQIDEKHVAGVKLAIAICSGQRKYLRLQIKREVK